MYTTNLDPSLEQQRDMFANAIQDAVTRAGIIRKDAGELSGPQLLQFLGDLTDHYIQLCENQNETLA